MGHDAADGGSGAAVITITDNEPTPQAPDVAVIDVEAAAEEGEQHGDDGDEVEVVDGADTTADADARRAGNAVEQEQAGASGATVSEGAVLLHARNAKKLEEELQCVLCHDGLFKPVTATCGHSFCRVCLVESCLSRALDEAQCPVCRADVMSHFSENTPIAFHVNVTLWNLIQLLVPREEHKDYEHEEQEYALKLDQLDAKWRIQSLRAAAEQFHSEREGTILGTLDDEEEDEDYVQGDDEDDDDDDDSNDDDVDIEGEWYQDDDDEEGARRSRSFASGRRRQRQLEERRRSHQQRNRYPELKVENMVDGRLRVTRNVLLDTEDANEDGIISMRVGLALVEFPSILGLYSEHQECSLAILKMEEDEEMDTGFPFFMNESGDDDALVISDYSNEITLKVFDDGGNNVMQRTRAARHGTVEFPHLRLDVPAGEYTFHFSDDLYGTYLTVKTELRDLHETNDAPLDNGGTHRSYVLDESAENDRSRRGQRRRQRTESDEEDANLLWNDEDSDDSFIVNDEDGDEEPAGAFSDDGSAWEFQSDDREGDEARAQRLQNIRRARARERRQSMVHDMTGSDGSDRGDQDDEDHEDDENDPELVSQDTDEHEVQDNDDDDDAAHPQHTSARRRNNSNRVVIDSDDDEDHEEQDNNEREQKLDDDDRDAELVDREEVVRSGKSDEAGDADKGHSGEEHSEGDRDEECKESEDQQTSSSVDAPKEEESANDRETRNDEPSYVDVSQSSEHEVTPVRPAKRTRAKNVVLSENEDEEEDEQEEKKNDRNDSKKQKTAHQVRLDDDENNDGDIDDDGKYERMHPFLDGEREELHEAQDAKEEEQEQEEQIDYGQEDDGAEEGAFSEDNPDDEDPCANEEDPFQEQDEEEALFNNLDDGDGWD